jgi:CRISPR/Cas system-associated protein Cas10 (large subunit of type III CRISPR-Cas system)
MTTALQEAGIPLRRRKPSEEFPDAMKPKNLDSHIRDAGERICSVCHEMKPLSEFYPDERHPGGVKARCKLCHNAANMRYFQALNRLRRKKVITRSGT